MRPVRCTTVPAPDDLLALVGQDLGASEPQVVTQDQVDRFADVTKDHQWIHVDVERARSGPFGTTIVHGFLTLSLVPRLLADVLEVRTYSMGVNYGLDRVRFVKPLPPGVQIQGSATLLSATPIAAGAGHPAGVQAKASVVVEFAGDGETCCAAEILFRYYS
ncbi:MaoC family dehydratase [Dactylosporangium aurantiacum]|uniref:MaoC family dehydratase n=1 Tax=Dactylosporangium aurantiacum TaxID=35754 RepID=A0A9Q9IRT7_9ACTN|nr:MaoC family dehydratase [Dactylosporangium aurantiacum]MDG6106266.1 MaoC family dehydratase [Dactylosporangium aurantiacum]UWZ58234.1 MaoC family dehydratase [Dactylosporangium aurantiacum]